jgi:hypothetical protein
MALTPNQRAALNRAFSSKPPKKSPGYGRDGSKPYRHNEDETGGEAERRYWAMHDKKYQAGYRNGGRQGRPIPSQAAVIKPIPNARKQGGPTKFGNPRTRST